MSHLITTKTCPACGSSHIRKRAGYKHYEAGQYSEIDGVVCHDCGNVFMYWQASRIMNCKNCVCYKRPYHEDDCEYCFCEKFEEYKEQ